MSKFIFKRLLVSIPTFIGITLMVFVLSNLAPGGPLTGLSATMSEEAIAQLEHEYSDSIKIVQSKDAMYT